jgi:hypothetical protein
MIVTHGDHLWVKYYKRLLREGTTFTERSTIGPRRARRIALMMTSFGGTRRR